MCAIHDVVVVAYEDRATGTMQERPDGSGVFTRVLLRPQVTISHGSDPAKATDLHHAAHEKCFIANSVNCPVEVQPVIVAAEAPSAAQG